MLFNSYVFIFLFLPITLLLVFLANKYQKIRSALCWNKEIVALAREHNDANILSLPARFISIPQAIEMVKVFISTKFEGGRHQKRIDKIPCK